MFSDCIRLKIVLSIVVFWPLIVNSLPRQQVNRKKNSWGSHRRHLRSLRRLRGGFSPSRTLRELMASSEDTQSIDLASENATSAKEWERFYPDMRKIWCKALNKPITFAESIKPSDEFYSIGGHPLQLTEIQRQTGMNARQVTRNRTLARHTRIFGMSIIEKEHERKHQETMREFWKKFDSPNPIERRLPDSLACLRYSNVITIATENQVPSYLLRKSVQRQKDKDTGFLNEPGNRELSPSQIEASQSAVTAKQRQKLHMSKPSNSHQFGSLINIAKKDINFDALSGIAVDGDGVIYLSDQRSHQVKKLTRDQDGLYVVFATGIGRASFADGPPSIAMFNEPKQLALNPEGNIVVADSMNHRIRVIGKNGTVWTLAGRGNSGSADGLGTKAFFDLPTGVACDRYGNTFVADSRNCKIRRITPDGEVTTYAGTGEFGNKDGYRLEAGYRNPWSLAVNAEGNIVVSSAPVVQHNLRKIDPDGNVKVLAGSGRSGYRDGQGNEAAFNAPMALALDPHGNVIVADTMNHAIRAVTKDGHVFTLIGGNRIGHRDGLTVNATLNTPAAITTDIDGNVYIADSLNQAIRVIVRNDGTSFEASSRNSSLPTDLCLVNSASIENTPVASREESEDENASPFCYKASSRGTSPVPEAFTRWGSVERALDSSWRAALDGYYNGNRFIGPPEAWSGYGELQEIIPGLFLGGPGAGDVALLDEAGITHVLVVAGIWEIDDAEYNEKLSKKENSKTLQDSFMFRDRIPKGVEIDYKECVLGGLYDVDELMLFLVPWFEKALHTDQRVLVCCKTGVMLAPSIIISFLIYLHEYTFEIARDFVQERREIINIPDWLQKQILKVDSTMNVIAYAGANVGEDGDSSLDRMSFPGEANSDDIEEEKIRQRQILDDAEALSRPLFEDGYT